MSDDSTRPGTTAPVVAPGDAPTVPRRPAAPADGELKAIGRYRLLEVLGSGGMGVVYSAFDPTLDRKVALKLLTVIAAPTDRDQMLAEARALARLNHPNVVAVHEVGEVDGRAFLALEYAEGETLEFWLRSRRRAWRDVVQIFLEAGQGLHAAHLAGLVHRDFKPTNVMIRHDGRVQLLDFGIARASAPRADPDAKGPSTTIAGTPGFMSPEQLVGERLDARSDQFSFCVALYEALYEVLPFGADPAQLYRIQQGQLALPPVKANVPRKLREILQQGLAAAPGQRFASMGELMQRLRRALPPDRRGWVLIAALCVVAGTSVAAAWLRSRPAPLSCVPQQLALEQRWAQSLRPKVVSVAGDTAAGDLDAWLLALSTTAQTTCADLQAGRRPEELLLKERVCLVDRQREFVTAAEAAAEPARRGEALELLTEAAPPEACRSSEAAAAFDVYQRQAPARQAVSLATRAWLDGDWEDGLGVARRAQRAAHAVGAAELESLAARLEGLMLERLGELQLAERVLHRAAVLGEGTGDDARAAAWVALARVAAARGADAEVPWLAYARSEARRFPQRIELQVTLGLLEQRGHGAAPGDELLGQLLPEKHPLHAVIAARAHPDEALTALEREPQPSASTLVGVADALDRRDGLSWRRLLALADAKLPPAGHPARLAFARLAREAGAADAARDVASRVLGAAEARPALAALARCELGAAQLALGSATEALQSLEPGHQALATLQRDGGDLPARAARCRRDHALALGAAKKPEAKAELARAREELRAAGER